MALKRAIEGVRDKRRVSAASLRDCDARIQGGMDAKKLSYLRLNDRQFLRLVHVTRQRRLTSEVVRQACGDLRLASAREPSVGGDRQSWRGILLDAARQRIRRRSRVVRLVPRIIRGVPSSHVGEVSADMARVLQERSHADETLRLLRAKSSRLNMERHRLAESEDAICESFGTHGAGESVHVHVGGRRLRVSCLERVVGGRAGALGIGKMMQAWDAAAAMQGTLEDSIEAFLSSVSLLQRRPTRARRRLRIASLNSPVPPG